MHHTKLVALLATAFVAVCGQRAPGQRHNSDNIPQECRATCQSAIDLENGCDSRFDERNNWQGYRNCVCDDSNARSGFSACNDCVNRYPNYQSGGDRDGGPDHNESDMDELRQWPQACGFSGSGSAGVGGNLPANTGTGGIFPDMTPFGSPMPTGLPTGPSGPIGQQSLTTGTTTYTVSDINGGQPRTITSTGVFPVGPLPTSWSQSWSTSTATYTYTDNNGQQRTMTTTGVVPVSQRTNGVGSSTSYTVMTTTGPNGVVNTFSSGVVVATGAAPVATAMPYFGAAAGFFLGALAL